MEMHRGKTFESLPDGREIMCEFAYEREKLLKFAITERNMHSFYATVGSVGVDTLTPEQKEWLKQYENYENA